MDQALAKMFAPLINRLSPLLPSGIGQIKLKAHAYSDGLTSNVLPGNVLHLSGARPTKKNPTSGRVEEFVASDIESAERFARAAGIDLSECVIERRRDSELTRLWMDSGEFGPQAEVAALKALMLTFDHLMADVPEGERFTRAPELAHVRAMVKAAVLEDNFAGIGGLSLGLQYDKLAEIQLVRNRLVARKSDFEHVLIVTTNSASKCLDCVFWVASVHPFGFRLYRPWTSKSFTAVVVSGILAGSPIGSLEVLPEVLHLRPYPNLKSTVPMLTKHVVADAERGARSIGGYLGAAISQATKLVEQTADKFVVKCLRDFAWRQHQWGRPSSVRSSVLKRLIDQWGLSMSKEGARQRAADELDRLLLAESSEFRAEIVCDAQGRRVDWERWLSIYRTALDQLQADFGPPGEFEPSGVEISVGKLKDMKSTAVNILDTSNKKSSALR